MIPKVIHYCWFGGQPLPESALKCIESWKKYCPDYEIKRWDESNYDFSQYNFSKEAYEQGKFAFVADLARLDIIFREGGIYLDTDVELLKPLDDLLDNQAYMGLESPGRINTGLGFGAEVGHEMVRKNIEAYLQANFSEETTCVTYTSKVFKDHGLTKEDKIQEINGVKILPVDYLCPMNFVNGKLNITENSYSIHHYDATWKNGKDRFLGIKVKLRSWLGDEFYDKIKKRMK